MECLDDHEESIMLRALDLISEIVRLLLIAKDTL